MEQVKLGNRCSPAPVSAPHCPFTFVSASRQGDPTMAMVPGDQTGGGGEAADGGAEQSEAYSIQARDIPFLQKKGRPRGSAPRCLASVFWFREAMVRCLRLAFSRNVINYSEKLNAPSSKTLLSNAGYSFLHYRACSPTTEAA